MASLENPGDVYILPTNRIFEVINPVSSASSRIAHSSGSSPASILPAGISRSSSSTAFLNCFTNNIFPS